MPDGTGFPRKLNAMQIGPMSALFIVTGIWARFILKHKHEFKKDLFVNYLESNGYSRGNYKDPFNAIKNL